MASSTNDKIGFSIGCLFLTTLFIGCIVLAVNYGGTGLLWGCGGSILVLIFLVILGLVLQARHNRMEIDDGGIDDE